MSGHRRNADGSRDRLGQCPDCNKPIVFDGTHKCSPPATEDLGRRAVVCKGWRPMGGMLDIESGLRAVTVDGGGFVIGRATTWRADKFIPDLTDPATLGCLLALVREAWGDPGIYVQRRDYPNDPPDSWVWLTDGRTAPIVRICGTEAEALVAALESQP